MQDIVYSLSYRDILLLPRDFKKQVLKMFMELVQDIPNEVYSDNKTLNEMMLESELLLQAEVSDYVFGGNRVKYYPNLKFRKTLKDFTCPVSSAIVEVGSEVVVWNPLFWLPELKETYVLTKSIKASCYYSDFFPTDIITFDDFYFKVNNSYDLDLDDYYSFYVNIGGLSLKKLKK